MVGEGALSGAVKDIVAGTIGGMTTVVVGHPLDTVKVRLQTSTSHYSSMVDCIVKTWQVEGVRGYYKGVQSPLAGEAFFNAIQFLAYGQSKQLLTHYRTTAAGAVDEAHGLPLPAGAAQLSVSDYFIAGGLTGAASCLVECPVDLLKSQLQTVIYRPNPPFTSFTSAVSFVLRHRGVRGLYQGLAPTFARTIPSTAAYFGCYEWCRTLLTRGQQDEAEAESEAEHSAVILIAGGVGGFAYWLSTYPADSVKVRHLTTRTTHTPTSTTSLLYTLRAHLTCLPVAVTVGHAERRHLSTAAQVQQHRRLRQATVGGRRVEEVLQVSG